MHKSKRKRGNIVIKINLYKAYGSIDWGFLRQTLIDFNFPNKIIQLIMFCVSSSSLSLVWNGVQLESFSPNRGLRQGDPISPYLFVLCMERLSMMISEIVEKGVWKPVRIAKNGISISYLLFANDILLFIEAKVSQIRLNMNILQEFEIAMVSKSVTRQKKER